MTESWLNLPFEVKTAHYLVSCPARACLSERNGLGEQSRTSWAYSKKALRTNEIVRTVTIMQHFPYNGKIAAKACASPLGSPDPSLHERVGSGDEIIHCSGHLSGPKGVCFTKVSLCHTRRARDQAANLREN